MKQSEERNLKAGDRLVLTVAGTDRIWTVSAVNNQVVKYFEETGRYGQMPLAHLTELFGRGQARLEPGDAGDS